MCGPDGMNRFEFQRRFEKAKENLGKDDSARLCLTPISWIEKALPRNYSLERLHCLDDFFPRREKKANLSEFIIVHVILNCQLLRASTDVEGGGFICDGGEHDPDAVRYAPAYCDDDLLPDRDFVYRTLVAFLPGAGVLYCPSEHCGAKVGVEGSLIPLDMSWLRLHEDVTAGQGRRYSFGEDGSVKCCFFGEAGRSAAYDHCLASVHWSSLWPEHHAVSGASNAVLRCRWTAHAPRLCCGSGLIICMACDLSWPGIQQVLGQIKVYPHWWAVLCSGLPSLAHT
jgi:hypothetical protein